MVMLGELLTVDEFYDAAAQGKLLGLKCGSGHVTVPPRRSCRICGSKALKKIKLSGRGSVLSFTGVFVKSREFPIEVPYTLALVQLEEGGNLMGIVEKPSERNIAYGSQVTAKFQRLADGEWPRIFFSLGAD